MMRLAELLVPVLARAMERPKSGEFKVPMGGARLTWLKRFWMSEPISSEYLRLI